MIHPPLIPLWPGHAPSGAAGPAIDSSLPIPRYGVVIGPIGLLVPQGIATEAMPVPEPYVLPHSPAWFRGIVHRRGDVVPVFDLRRRWFPGLATPGRRTLWVLDKGETAVGLLIDGLPQALRGAVEPEDSPATPQPLAGFAGPALRQDDTLYWEFRHTEFFHSLRTALAAG
ncbi:chemotaxis protein CheW [Methylomagnum ishizawai]|uniref:chemotaxis protein CheW n=1 Tax=Methylomagnum ishizawai TaxID=1760988 RepID=UPI001C31F987|nr:chemotaxis protein CheW [Methylomagnum ishizawai]BBL76041.1 hypothetical protein MishRS11D_31390 [Methylomagnum ishizawai]